MKTVLVLVLLAVVATGCATYDAAQEVVAQRSAQAADEARETAEWTLCNGISVGAWRRAYANDAGKAGGWARLCAQPEVQPR